MTEYLGLEDLLALCEDLGRLQVRDVGLLDAAAQRQGSSLFGRDAYPSIHEKAAVLLESLCRNHALVDGNKRISWLAVHVFYGLNGHTLDAPDTAAYDLIITVSTGAATYEEVAVHFAGWAQAAGADH